MAFRVCASAGAGMSVDQDFEEFVAARWTALYRLSYLLTASPAAAEDLLQTSLEKAYVRWGRIGGMEHAEAYVRRIVANTYVSGRRRAWVREEPRDQMPETANAVDGALLDRALLWPLVCALPARQRAVIVLRYYEDLSEADIATTLGCAPGTVKSQASAAMKALRRALAATGAGEAVGES
jgi:RNA polymerase sigma-70 factor (sigma-E family)